MISCRVEIFSQLDFMPLSTVRLFTDWKVGFCKVLLGEEKRHAMHYYGRCCNFTIQFSKETRTGNLFPLRFSQSARMGKTRELRSRSRFVHISAPAPPFRIAKSHSRSFRLTFVQPFGPWAGAPEMALNPNGPNPSQSRSEVTTRAVSVPIAL